MSTTDRDNVIKLHVEEADDAALSCEVCGYAVFNLLASHKIECAICGTMVNGVWRHHDNMENDHG